MTGSETILNRIKTDCDQKVNAIELEAGEKRKKLLNDAEAQAARLESEIADKTSRTVLRRLTRNLHANDDLVYEYMTNRFNGIEKYKDCSKRFSRDSLRYKSDSDFDLLWQILTSMLKNALFNFYVTEDDCAHVRQEYRRKLEILKHGALA